MNMTSRHVTLFVSVHTVMPTNGVREAADGAAVEFNETTAESKHLLGAPSASRWSSYL